MRKTTLTVAVLVLLLTASSCGATKTQTNSTGGQAARRTTTAQPTAVQVVAAVRTAVVEHHHLSIRVLWTNQLPRTVRVIGGPALADLRDSLAARRKRGVRVRLVSERFRIVSIKLAPSYAAAVAVVADAQRVRPYGYSGHPLGRPVALDEHARIDLHRLGRRPQFVVWKVTAIP